MKTGKTTVIESNHPTKTITKGKVFVMMLNTLYYNRHFAYIKKKVKE